MKSLIPTFALGTCLLLPSAGVTFAADPHMNGATGRPNQSCQTSFNPDGSNARPGSSASSPGSVFNEPGFPAPGTDSVNGGTGGNAYNAAGAPSQYDVACFQQSVNHPPQ
jgi:hypothetical protein